MSTEDNKALVHRLYEEVFNRGNLSTVDELLAADYIDLTRNITWSRRCPVPGLLNTKTG